MNIIQKQGINSSIHKQQLRISLHKIQEIYYWHYLLNHETCNSFVPSMFNFVQSHLQVYYGLYFNNFINSYLVEFVVVCIHDNIENITERYIYIFIVLCRIVPNIIQIAGYNIESSSKSNTLVQPRMPITPEGIVQ